MSHALAMAIIERRHSCCQGVPPCVYNNDICISGDISCSILRWVLSTASPLLSRLWKTQKLTSISSSRISYSSFLLFSFPIVAVTSMMLYRRLATLAVLGTAHCFPQSVASASSPYYSKRDELVDINRRQGLEWLDQAIASRSVLSEIEEREIDDEYHFFERSTDELFDRGSLLFARAFGARPPPVPPKPESLRTSSVTPGSSSTAQRPTTGGSSAPSPPSGPPPGRPPVPVAPV